MTGSIRYGYAWINLKQAVICIGFVLKYKSVECPTLSPSIYTERCTKHFSIRSGKAIDTHSMDDLTVWMSFEVPDSLGIVFCSIMIILVLSCDRIFTSFVSSKPDGRKTVLGKILKFSE